MKKSIAIIGGGAAGLTCACFLDSKKYDITLYEKNKTAGRKFLVAGKGGFNLTHAEPMNNLIEKYSPRGFMDSTIRFFDNTQLRSWLAAIGISTYIGTSHRIFPTQGIKPIEVLNAIMKVLDNNNVKVAYEQNWLGWDQSEKLSFNNGKIYSDFTIFALGGSTWKVTGSDGGWVSNFKKMGIETHEFQASNCAYKIPWKSNFIDKYEGRPFKNISITSKGKTIKGEVVVTQFGLEGNAIYALSPEIRTDLKLYNQAEIFLDLKPTLTEATILSKLEKSSGKNTTQSLKQDLKLSNTMVGLLKTYVSKKDYLDNSTLAKIIKSLSLSITDLAPIDEAISSVGGISLAAIDNKYELINKPNSYCIGEMLDWDAPTGGYLLQGCISQGVYLANHLNDKT